jgi:hypothetical protein
LISSSSPCIGHVRDTLYTRERTRKKLTGGNVNDETEEDDEDHMIEFQSTKPPGMDKLASFENSETTFLQDKRVVAFR